MKHFAWLELVSILTACVSLFDLNAIIFHVSLSHRFQRACTLYGLSDVDLFQTTDLWDFKNIALVTQTIFAIGRAVCIRTLIILRKLDLTKRVMKFDVSLHRHTSIQNTEDHVWDHVQLKRTVVISPKTLCAHQRLSLAFKLAQIAVQTNPVKALVHLVKSFLESRKLIDGWPTTPFNSFLTNRVRLSVLNKFWYDKFR